MTFFAAMIATAALGASLEIPPGFDPSVNMMIRTRSTGSDHSVLDSAAFAERLVANGTPEDLTLAEKVLDAVLACQETRPGHAYHGNYLWYREAPAVQDLNAVGFTQRALVPMMIRHADRLSPGMRQRVLESIRYGCDAIRRMDVAITYTNIASLDCLSSCLGGELLDDPGIRERGYERLKRLADVTAANGTVYEFNSPNYMGVTMGALDLIADLVRDDATRIRARTMAARLALSAALHLQSSTGRLAGAYSRGFLDDVMCTNAPERDIIRQWVADGTAPAWLGAALNAATLPVQLTETAHAEWRIGTTLYQTPSFALGTATREISRQTHPFVVHCPVPESGKPVVIFTRYLVDDTWFGDPERPADRSQPTRLADAGQAYAAQWGTRAIVLYAPRILEYPASLAPASQFTCRSAKLAVVCTQRRLVESVWIGDDVVGEFPAPVAPGQTVTFVAGGMLLAVRPLTRSDMGVDAPMRLAAVEDELVFELYNYLGPEKTFWDADRQSRFFRGEPFCGFYAEAADRSDYPDPRAFVKAVVSGRLRDEAAPPVTGYRDDQQRPWTVEYSRAGESLGIEVDLLAWELNRRWTHEGELGWPMLESPLARQNAAGKVVVGDAVLTCGKNPAWLYGNPGARLWVAGYNGPAARLRLEVPGGSVRVKSMGTGLVVWDNGRVSIDAVDLAGTPQIRGGR